MSNTGGGESAPIQSRSSPPPERSGCLTAILIVSGIILLFPGLCSLVIVFGGFVKNAEDAWFVAGLMALGAIGVAMIWWAVRRRRP